MITPAFTALAGLAFAASAPAVPARDYQLRTLPNGLTVIAVPDHALPLATVEIGVRNGAMTEPPELNGLSHLYEHMFFKGNLVLPNQEAFLEKSRALGMVFNGATEEERVNYFFTTTSGELRPAMEMMRDSAVGPLFDPAELAREEQVVIGEIDRDDADPYSHFTRAIDRALWKYPSYKDPLGDRATVSTATAEKMRLIQRRYYVPNNAVLIIAGDIQADAAFALAAELFGGWGRAADPFAAHPVLEQPPLTHSRVLVVLQPVKTASLAFQWHGPSVRPDELAMTYAADVLGALAAEPGARFQRDLVDSGLCVRASLSWETAAHVGPVALGLEAAETKVDACARAALTELAVLAEPGTFSDAELRNAKLSLEVGKALEREAPSQYAHVLSGAWSVTGLDYYDGYLEHARGVTQADLAAFLAGYVLGKPFVFGALLAPEVAKAHHLDGAHFEALLGVGK